MSGFINLTVYFQVVLYSWSTVSHVGVGGVCLLAVVYCLRWELKLIIEKVLLLAAKILGKFGSKSSSRSKDKFSNVMIIDTVHHLLYQTWQYISIWFCISHFIPLYQFPSCHSMLQERKVYTRDGCEGRETYWQEIVANGKKDGYISIRCGAFTST